MASKSARAQALWFPKEYWTRPAAAIIGSPNESIVYESVGRCLSEWELVEEVLAKFFVVIAKEEKPLSDTNFAIERTYGSIESGSARRKAFDAVAEIYFGREWTNPTLKKPYEHLMENIRRAATRRDDVAHGVVMGITTGVVILRKGINPPVVPGDKEHPTNHGFFLWPANYHNSRTDAFISEEAILKRDGLAMQRAHYRYTHSDIHSFTKKFGKLRSAIARFFFAVVKKDGQFDFEAIARSHADGSYGDAQ